MRPINRIKPKLPPEAFKTYAITSPVATHYRPGTCAEANCGAQAHGWVTRVDETTDLGQKQAHYIRRDSGRKFTEARTPAGLTEFTFEAGQKCFATHQVSLQRPENFLVLGGDWRGNPRGIKPVQHTRPEHWVEDFGGHQQTLADRFQQG